MLGFIGMDEEQKKKRGRPRIHKERKEVWVQYRKNLGAHGYKPIHVYVPADVKAIVDDLAKKTELPRAVIVARLIKYFENNPDILPGLFPEESSKGE